MRGLKILLTGFEPFDGEAINPAWEAVKRLSREGIEGIEIICKQVPTVFGISISQAITATDLHQPDIVIAVGQAGGRSAISIERVALNVNDAGIPDNENNQPLDTPVLEGAPAAYFSTLPIKAMVEAIRQAGIPASISNTAGTFVCNHLMYGILHHIAENQLPIQAGFIHLPYLPEQAVNHRGAPSMGLSDMVVALKVAVTVAAQLRIPPR